MEIGLASYAIAFLAGGLSILAPCVLPLLPILLLGAASAHRHGAFALAGGLALSFTATGIVIAGLGSSLGLDPASLRNGAAVLLTLFGLVLLSGSLQARFATATAGLSSLGNYTLTQVDTHGLRGQFLLGALLGLVWSPCIGPTLGVAITLASQGEQLAQVSLVMALFGLGAGLPLAALGLVSREALLRTRSRLLAVGSVGKKALGATMLALGLLILTGTDKVLERWALELMPHWLSEIGTRL